MKELRNSTSSKLRCLVKRIPLPWTGPDGSLTGDLSRVHRSGRTSSDSKLTSVISPAYVANKKTFPVAYASLLGILILVLTALGSTFAVSAKESTVEGTFRMFGHTGTREYLYNDDFFSADPEQYDHDLARLSLGLALAAGRDKDHPDAQDDLLIDFLHGMGFDRIESAAYRTEPTADSIAFGLASKEIGESTIVACAVCGGDYGQEWASNLTVGDSVRSEGFQDAAQKVEAALDAYLDEHSVTGDAKLWVTGYSRAGATANIVAADYTDSGRFDDVYAYTFATPRTTREPGTYHNIFNIIQKEDIVPKVPLADWGYERYGKDLFLISPETDSDCEEVLKKAARIYRDMYGSEMVFNSEINYEIRILLDYMLALMPDSATYTRYLQPLLVDIIKNSDGTMNALQILLKALQQYSTDDPVAGEELKALRDYVGTLVETYVLQEGVKDLPPERWDPDNGILNLFNAHIPFEYLGLMYASDDPGEIFSDHGEYIRLVVYADADITISDDEGILKEILADGTELKDGIEAPYSLPDAYCYEDKVVITLPADQSYLATVTSRAGLPQTITYTGLRFFVDTIRAQTDDLYSYLMNRGDTAQIRTQVQGKAIEASKSDHTDVSAFTDLIYSPTTAMRLEHNRVVHLTISGLVNRLLLLIVILILQLIASIILTIIRKKTGRKRNKVVAFIWHGIIAALFAILEVAMWYFAPVLTIAKMIPGTLVFIVISVYAIKGSRTESRKWKACWILIGILAAYLILESLLIGDFTVAKGILLLAVYAGFITAAYIILWHSSTENTENTQGRSLCAGSEEVS